MGAAPLQAYLCKHTYMYGFLWYSAFSDLLPENWHSQIVPSCLLPLTQSRETGLLLRGPEFVIF